MLSRGLDLLFLLCTILCLVDERVEDRWPSVTFLRAARTEALSLTTPETLTISKCI